MNGVIRAPRCSFARNLLDNSDFRNPVNQRGATSYNTAGYAIDRWYLRNGYTQMTIQSDGISISSLENKIAGINHTISPEICEQIKGKICTIAACKSTGELIIASGLCISESVSSNTGLFTTNTNQNYIGVYKIAETGYFEVRIVILAGEKKHSFGPRYTRAPTPPTPCRRTC